MPYKRAYALSAYALAHVALNRYYSYYSYDSSSSSESRRRCRRPPSRSSGGRRRRRRRRRRRLRRATSPTLEEFTGLALLSYGWLRLGLARNTFSYVK